MKKIILIFIMTFFLSIVSAYEINIYPNSFNFNSFPGETVYKNITIRTDGIYPVFLYLIGINSTTNITINQTEPIAVNFEKNLTIGFIFGSDIPIGNYNFGLEARANIPENIIIRTETINGAGGTRIIYQDKNDTIKKIKEIEEENKNLKNQLNDLKNAQTPEKQTNKIEITETERYVLLIAIFLGTITIIILSFLLKKYIIERYLIKKNF